MKGLGTKKLKNGIEIHGTFDNANVSGKGYKKWRRVTYAGRINHAKNKKVEIFIYRGTLNNGIIEGRGEFKWPDGRHYIGDFFNYQLEGIGKLMFKDKYGGKAIYKG